MAHYYPKLTWQKHEAVPGCYMYSLKHDIMKKADEEFDRHVHRELVDAEGITIAKWIPDCPRSVVVLKEPLLITTVTVDFTHLP